jgi:hypothetical protein
VVVGGVVTGGVPVGAGAYGVSMRSWGPGEAGGQTGLSCGPDVLTGRVSHAAG